MRTRSQIRVAVHCALMGIAGLLILCFTAQAQDLPYRNPSLPVEQRVADLLSRMTLEEKVAQLEGAWEDRRFFKYTHSPFIPTKSAFFSAHAPAFLAKSWCELPPTN